MMQGIGIMTRAAAHPRVAFATAIACLAIGAFSSEQAIGQVYSTLNTSGTVAWNNGSWSPGLPDAANEVGLTNGGGTVIIDGTSTNTTPGSLLNAWNGSFNTVVNSGTLSVTGTFGDPSSGRFGLTVAESGNGTFTQNGGLVIAPLVNVVRVAGGTAAGSYVLNSGTLQSSRIRSARTSGTFVFDGGTVQASASNGIDFLAVNTRIAAGGGIIDTAGFDAMVTGTITGTNGGGLTKAGAGTLTLSSAASIDGLTTINAGSLSIQSDFSGPISVGAAGTLQAVRSGTFASPISGSGGFVFAGPLVTSTMTLTGSNT